jgi:hypothetical protein
VRDATERAADLVVLRLAADEHLVAVRFEVVLSLGVAERATVRRVRIVAGRALFFFFMTYSSVAVLCALEHGPQRFSAEQMQVQVIDLLSAIGIAIHNEAIAALGDSLFARKIARDDDHVSDQRRIVILYVIRCRDGLMRHN